MSTKRKIQVPKLPIDEIVVDSMALSDYAKEAYKESLKAKTDNDTFHYYQGILMRHHILNRDIHTLMGSPKHFSLNTIEIILRAMLDDFLHLSYLKMYSSKTDEAIIKLNAKEYAESFKSIKEAADINEQVFEGKDKNLPTQGYYDHVLAKFKSVDQNAKYFKTDEKTDFKGFLQMKQVVAKLCAQKNYANNAVRAYYLWKSYSGIVHYSSVSFDREKHWHDGYYKMIQESLLYSFNTIGLAIDFFDSNGHFSFFCDDKFLERGYVFFSFDE
ncbi:hypothetical protein O3Q51_07775 [Cryomorphaceae bacterium 1068]|nr:hypothetical protein [Cryomorphaceae bacterium 1068]